MKVRVGTIIGALLVLAFCSGGSQFSNRQTITLQVTLTAGVPGDKPIWRTLGCDSVSSSACTLTMTADRA